MSANLSRRIVLQATSASLASAAVPAMAQTAWPTKPIKIIVPYTAVPLRLPSSDTQRIVAAALKGLERIYRSGFTYAKAC